MKKIISILFLFCLVVCSPSRAQAQALAKVARTITSGRALPIGTPVKPPRVLPKVQQPVVSVKSTSQMPLGVNSVMPNSRVGTVIGSRSHLKSPSQNLRKPIHSVTPNFSLPDPYIPSHGLLRERGFIPQEHSLSTSSIEESQPSSPKVNLDKIRMKVMIKQNRLNKDEMKADEFIFIGLLINYNEYGEYYITDYAA